MLDSGVLRDMTSQMFVCKSDAKSNVLINSEIILISKAIKFNAFTTVAEI